MNLNRFIKVIENPNEDISDIKDYLIENYYKITKGSYKNQPLDREIILFRVFGYLSKFDTDLKNFIENKGHSDFKENLYAVITGEEKICKNGNAKIFDIRRYKYGLCGGQSCPCSVDKARKTWSKKTERELLEIRTKAQKTMIERYGEKHTMAIARDAYTIQTGFANPFNDPNIQQSIRDKRFEKSGVKYSRQRHFTEEAKAILFDQNNFAAFIYNKSITEMAEILNVDPSTICDYYRLYNITMPKSSYENEIGRFLENNNIAFEQNTRTVISKELDFYLPDYALGIEFNGLYWHSYEKLHERGESKNFHYNKWKLCNEANIRLLMINEDEWNYHKDAIKLKILNICGRSERGVGARHLYIKQIGNEGSQFCELHHIQGKTEAAFLNYGAFSGDDLVGVMCFNHQRGTNDVELARFCSDGKTYPGMFSKMFRFFQRENHDIGKVISFADLRYSDGGVYKKNGFVEDKIIPPDYRYFKSRKTYHKSSFTKNSIEKRFGIDMSNKTERQVMMELGYFRIYDCGKIKYTWTI